MAENCSHNCGSCSQNCGDRIIEKKKPLPSTHINKIIGVLSGKGGVGKSMVSSLLAVELAKKGYKVGIMDADITGPSIPKMFRVDSEIMGDNQGIYPNLSNEYCIKIVSVNMMLETEDTPVLWRGPVISSMVDQFYTDVYWGDLDYLVIDMPPGTSDVALSVLQDIPVDGLVMVTSASKLISMVVSKAIVMAEKTNSKIIGLVENMSYIKCPNCDEKITVFGKSNIDEIAKSFNIPVLARLPMEEATSRAVDAGDVESLYIPELEEAAKKVEALLK